MAGVNNAVLNALDILDLLGRALNLDVSPLLTDQDVEETIAAVRKVAEVVL